MEDGILFRRQFLSMPARSGRYGSEPLVENAEMEETRKGTIVQDRHSTIKTYARSRFIRRIFFLANRSLKYRRSLS